MSKVITQYLRPNAEETKRQLYVELKSLDPTKAWRVRIDEFSERTLEQNEKMHAMLGDIADQTTHLTMSLDNESWKRLCVDQFRKDCIEQDVPRLGEYWKKEQVRLIPGLDGSGLVALGAQTRDFPQYVAAGFITWLYAYGNDHKICWSEPFTEEELARYGS